MNMLSQLVGDFAIERANIKFARFDFRWDTNLYVVALDSPIYEFCISSGFDWIYLNRN